MALCALPCSRDFTCASTLMFPQANLMGSLYYSYSVKPDNRQYSVMSFLQPSLAHCKPSLVGAWRFLNSCYNRIVYLSNTHYSTSPNKSARGSVIFISFNLGLWRGRDFRLANELEVTLHVASLRLSAGHSRHHRQRLLTIPSSIPPPSTLTIISKPWYKSINMKIETIKNITWMQLLNIIIWRCPYCKKICITKHNDQKNRKHRKAVLLKMYNDT